MKKTLILASVILFTFSACKNGGNTPAQTAADPTIAREVSSQVAYIQLDSLMLNFDMFKELSGALEAKATKAENDITARGRNLERSFADAQEKVEKGLVTRAQAAELQEKLQRQEQTFVAHREKMQQELGEENQVMMNNVYHSLNKFVSEFNSDYKYGVILTTSGGTPILHADPALNITDIVTKGLNEAYAKEKAAKK